MGKGAPEWLATLGEDRRYTVMPAICPTLATGSEPYRTLLRRRFAEPDYVPVAGGDVPNSPRSITSVRSEKVASSFGFDSVIRRVMSRSCDRKRRSASA